MGVLSRVVRLCKADLHGVMDQMEDKDPLLRQHLREMEAAMADQQACIDRLEETLRTGRRARTRPCPAGRKSNGSSRSARKPLKPGGPHEQRPPTGSNEPCIWRNPAARRCNIRFGLGGVQLDSQRYLLSALHVTGRFPGDALVRRRGVGPCWVGSDNPFGLGAGDLAVQSRANPVFRDV